MVPLGKEEMIETLHLSPPRTSKPRDSRNIAALLVPSASLPVNELLKLKTNPTTMLQIGLSN